MRVGGGAQVNKLEQVYVVRAPSVHVGSPMVLVTCEPPTVGEQTDKHTWLKTLPSANYMWGFEEFQPDKVSSTNNKESEASASVSKRKGKTVYPVPKEAREIVGKGRLSTVNILQEWGIFDKKDGMGLHSNVQKKDN